MPDRDPNILTSGLSLSFSKDGATVEVKIYRLEHDPKWSLGSRLVQSQKAMAAASATADW